MSEEKPTFKIVDRRLFNADGTARELPEEEERARAAASEVAAPQPAEPAAKAREETRGSDAKSKSSAEPIIGAEAGATASEREAAPNQSGEDDDPQAFLMLVEFIASFAADALGLVDHAGEGRGEVNLPLARQCIDMLVTLKRKTHSNLTREEQQVLDTILSQLRMQYVKTANAQRGPQAARGFTGGDITGGR
jgi:hypothetical protein